MALRTQDSPIIPCVNCPLQTAPGLRPLTENQIQYARRYYNGAVNNLNTRIATFPEVIPARMFGFVPAEYFEFEPAKSS